MAYSGMCLFRKWMIQNHKKVATKLLKIEGFQVETIIHHFPRTQESQSLERDCLEHYDERSLKLCDCRKSIK